jgi:hypothetical protein
MQNRVHGRGHSAHSQVKRRRLSAPVRELMAVVWEELGLSLIAAVHWTHFAVTPPCRGAVLGIGQLTA